MSASLDTTVPAPDRATPGQVPAPDRRAAPGHAPARNEVPTPGRLATGRGTGIHAMLPRRALDMLPPGTLTVGAGLLVLGAGYYAHLAVAGHSLTADGMAALSVLWSIVFLLGLGVFLPIEQELIRLVAARTTVGEGIGPVVRRACLVSAIVLAVILAPLAAAAGPVADRLFGGDTAMGAVLAGPVPRSRSPR